MACFCNIVAEFPITEEGIISISLRTNQDVMLIQTACGKQATLSAGTKGDLSITAYADVVSERPTWVGTAKHGLWCPGNAGVNFNWDQRVECDGLTTHVIPRGGARSYKEGDVTSNVVLAATTDTSDSINASASSGPHTPYFKNERINGAGFTYSGGPIQISLSDATGKKNISFINDAESGILSADMYLMSFNWTYTPPNVPTVSYSFMVVYN